VYFSLYRWDLLGELSEKVDFGAIRQTVLLDVKKK